MTEKETMVLQGIQLGLDRIALQLAEQQQETADRNQYADLPEWIDLEQALALKRGVCPPRKRIDGKNRSGDDPMQGGASITTYRQTAFLQPCCGLNYKLVGGRKCWRKEDVVEWLSVTDENLKSYAEKRRVELPSVYKKRAHRGGAK